MGSYLDPVFLKHLTQPVKVILELGSRDIKDAVELVRHFDAEVYSFECNPDCLELCYNNFDALDLSLKRKINIMPFAVSTTDSEISFFPFDREKYDNIGSSSLLKIDFSRRDPSDPDFNRPNPQKEIKVSGMRMDTFCSSNYIDRIDLLCMDLQGYELFALESFGDYLKNVKYIITEASVNSTYDGGTCFRDLKEFLETRGFKFVCHNGPPNFFELAKTGFSEFDCMFENIQSPK